MLKEEKGLVQLSTVLVMKSTVNVTDRCDTYRLYYRYFWQEGVHHMCVLQDDKAGHYNVGFEVDKQYCAKVSRNSF